MAQSDVRPAEPVGHATRGVDETSVDRAHAAGVERPVSLADVEGGSLLPADVSTLVGPDDLAAGVDSPPRAFAGPVDEGGVEGQRGPPGSPAASSLPSSLDRYVLMGTLGRGGMGVVFKAFDPMLDRRVALKVLHKELNDKHANRLLREAQAMAKLSHPNVVQVYEAGEVGGRAFVAMELIHGQTIGAWMRGPPRPSWRECVDVFVQVGAGLAAAHGCGLVHRDFKPGNAIIDDQRRPRVLDFGLARQVDAVDEDPSIFDPQARSAHCGRMPLEDSLTKPGAVLGTPAYMPPEQMMGQDADARGDQFSFCVALYEAVYGERPYDDTSMAALMVSVARGDVRPVPKGSPVPNRLRNVLLRGLAAEPGARWPSMEALLEQLRRLVAPRRGRWLIVTEGSIAVLGLLGVGLAYENHQAHQARLVEVVHRCTGAREQLDGIWDDARRQEVHSAILDVERSHASGTWERLESQLDTYADTWADKYVEVCEATAIRHEQSEEAMHLRMRCLGQHRTSLRATVDVLTKADVEIVDNAVELVATLTPLTRCDDLDRLEQQDQRMPPPEDPGVVAKVEALRERMSEIDAMAKASRYVQALEAVEPVVPRAETLGYVPLLAEAQHLRGRLRERNGLYAEAEQDLKRAHTLAVEHDHDEIALHTAQALTFVVGNRLARYAEGRQWGQVAALPLALRSGDPVEVAASLNNLGTVYFEQGSYEEAKGYYEQALEIWKKTLGADHHYVARSLNSLGGVYFEQGEYERAKEYCEEALRIREKALGANHPGVAKSLNRLGGCTSSKESTRRPSGIMSGR
ncbi:MAG: serine/threonine-protein kinase [Myxococcota bacterium]